ncbi:predicted protein [Nematostella vectensis]|uniref:Uncharacterized protein n=1 Tax=Nematostella vectensis TaxID=45351 RepID=A7S1Z5_NEMVE|nr:predicted protein [Nematostella vectensis]|eukprot:XP_001634389.1 predicted protein [Nematostella vectensis]
MAGIDDRKMLKAIQHISEGNFYGLHVTNKAQRVSLDRELKTLEACKDAQTHSYRKEEKELLSALLRLQRCKDTDNLIEEHLRNHYAEYGGHKPDSHYGDVSHKPGSHYGDVSHKPGSNYGDSGQKAAYRYVDHGVKPGSHFHDRRRKSLSEDQTKVSQTSLSMPLSPNATLNPMKHPGPRRIPREEPAPGLPLREMGSEIHRTGAFIDCVICHLPRYLQLGGQGQVCTCEKGPGHESHRVHSKKEHLKAGPHKKTKETDITEASTDRRKSIDQDDMQGFLEKLNREMNIVLNDDKKRGDTDDKGSLDEDRFSTRRYSLDENGAFRGRRQSIDENGGYRGRRQSIDENGGCRGRRQSIDENGAYRGRRQSIDENGPYIMAPRLTQRDSIEEMDGRKRGFTNEMDYRRRGWTNDWRERLDSIGRESYYSIGDIRSRTGTFEDPNAYRKVFRAHTPFGHHQEAHSGGHAHTERGSSSHLPQLTNVSNDDNKEAYHMLVHPDNIHDHHHYLPYEANKDNKKGRHQGYGRHDSHASHGGSVSSGRHREEYHHKRGGHSHDRHHHGYYIHKYDHSGARQVAYIPAKGSSHVAEIIEKQHEPDSNHLAILSRLRQLLSVYQQMDDSTRKYPWPSPPSAHMTSEEFERLKDCR